MASFEFSNSEMLSWTHWRSRGHAGTMGWRRGAEVVLPPNPEQRRAEPRAPQRQWTASLLAANRVYFVVSVYFHLRCYELQQFKHIHFTMSSRAKSGFWIICYVGLFISFFFFKYEGHVSAQVLVKAVLNVTAT